MAQQNVEQKDLIVLGSGPGGYIAAIRASQLGRSVTIVEKDVLGGVCLNWGCIPSKALLKTAQLFNEIKHAANYGIQAGEPKADFDKIISRSRDVAGKLSAGVQFLMKKNKIEVVKGAGKLLGNMQLEVTDGTNTKVLGYKDIIIATGARARSIPGVTIDGKYFHTARTILENKVQPSSLLVIGAGAIGAEFAYFFNSLGTKVTLVEMLDKVLPIEDDDVSEALKRSLTKQGMTIKTGTAVSGLVQKGNKVAAVLKGAAGDEVWEGDACLIAIGVLGNVENIGLETVGIKVERGAIDIDNFMRTNVPNHFAIGDVCGAPWLAHVASHEGVTAAEVACGKAHHPMSYDNIPGCTYCQPQVASVGLTEKQAKDQGVKYKVGKVPFAAIGKAIAIGEPDGFIKTLLDPDTGEVLGVHIIHSEATELITSATLVRSHEGIAQSVVDTIHPHPTLSESLLEVMASALGRPLNT